MAKRMDVLRRWRWDAERLRVAHPPRFSHPSKQEVFARIGGGPWSGEVALSRWGPARTPDALRPPVAVRLVPGHFDYPTGAWTLNFADPDLFGYYGGRLLAQDELQVLEHPVLGSVREALLAEGACVATREPGGATPFLVQGAERRGRLDTWPGPTRPAGLYGNAFARARLEQVLDALTVLAPPIPSKLLALAAPHPGSGAYRLDEIHAILDAAYTGFAAVAAEGGGLLCTGFWGCGAFGGNRLLMTALQALAARQAGVDLCFYVGDPSGSAEAEAGLALLARVGRPTVGATLAALGAEGLRWGRSDGN